MNLYNVIRNAERDLFLLLSQVMSFKIELLKRSLFLFPFVKILATNPCGSSVGLLFTESSVGNLSL